MGLHPRDPLPRVLYIDLSTKRFWVEERRDLFEEYIGGAGVAIRLLREEVPRGADPLGPENAIVFAVGPFNALYPMASKTVAMFKSPLTGNLGESHAGGRSAIAIRLAGYGAIVIKGASDIPVWVSIYGRRVYFRDARALWGMRSTHTVGRIIREVEGGHGFRTIMRIGRAGERLVRYACVVVDTFRHFGRLGLGAVFGSKKLKGLVIVGRGSIPVVDKLGYRKVYDKIFKEIIGTPATKKYHELGTAQNVIPLNEKGALPTRNLKSARFEYAEELSGENLASKYLGRRVSCAHCPVACIHLAALREPYEHEPYFYKTTFVSYDYEPIYSMGTMLGISSAEGLLKLLDEVEVLGFDAIMRSFSVLMEAIEDFKHPVPAVDSVAVEEFSSSAEESMEKSTPVMTSPGLKVSFDRRNINGNFAVVVDADGTIDSSTSYAFEEYLVTALEKAPLLLVIDLSDIVYMSSSGWGVIVKSMQEMEKMRRRMVVAGMNSVIFKIFRDLGFEPLIPHYTSVESALEKFAEEREEVSGVDIAWADKEKGKIDSAAMDDMPRIEKSVSPMDGGEGTVEPVEINEPEAKAIDLEERRDLRVDNDKRVKKMGWKEYGKRLMKHNLRKNDGKKDR